MVEESCFFPYFLLAIFTILFRLFLSHLYNLKNVKNTHGGVILLVKLQVSALLKVSLYYNNILLKVSLFHGRFPRFLNCTNGTKSCSASLMLIFGKTEIANFESNKKNHTISQDCNKMLIVLGYEIWKVMYKVLVNFIRWIKTF